MMRRRVASRRAMKNVRNSPNIWGMPPRKWSSRQLDPAAAVGNVFSI